MPSKICGSMATPMPQPSASMRMNELRRVRTVVAMFMPETKTIEKHCSTCAVRLVQNWFKRSTHISDHRRYRHSCQKRQDKTIDTQASGKRWKGKKLTGKGRSA